MFFPNTIYVIWWSFHKMQWPWCKTFLRGDYTTRIGNFILYDNFLTNSLKFIKVYIIRKGILRGKHRVQKNILLCFQKCLYSMFTRAQNRHSLFIECIFFFFLKGWSQILTLILPGGSRIFPCRPKTKKKVTKAIEVIQTTSFAVIVKKKKWGYPPSDGVG